MVIFSKETAKHIVLAMITLLLSIPVHEYGHYIVAEIDGAEILGVNYFVSYNSTHITYPCITVNEFTFSSPEALILYYLAGMLITFVPALLLSICLYSERLNIWRYPYMWVISAPLVSLTDIDRIFELLGLSNIVRWVHVGLGAYTVLALGFMGRKVKE